MVNSTPILFSSAAKREFSTRDLRSQKLFSASQFVLFARVLHQFPFNTSLVLNALVLITYATASMEFTSEGPGEQQAARTAVAVGNESEFRRLGFVVMFYDGASN